MCVGYRMSRWVYVIRAVQAGAELIVLKELKGGIEREMLPCLKEKLDFLM